MDRDAKRDWQVRIAALLIFVLGFAAGALAFGLYVNSREPVQMSDGPSLGPALDALGLTDDQRAKVRSIFADARTEMSDVRKECGPKFREVRDRTDARLQEVLTAEQWEQFKKSLDEWRGHRRHDHRDHSDRGDRPGESRQK